MFVIRFLDITRKSSCFISGNLSLIHIASHIQNEQMFYIACMRNAVARFYSNYHTVYKLIARISRMLFDRRSGRIRLFDSRLNQTVLSGQHNGVKQNGGTSISRLDT